MTATDLKRLLAEAITPVSIPWNIEQQRPSALLEFLRPDAELVVAAVNALPALLAEREEMLRLLEIVHESEPVSDVIDDSIAACLAKARHAAHPEARP